MWHQNFHKHIVHVETQYDLYTMTISGEPIWPLLRFHVFWHMYQREHGEFISKRKGSVTSKRKMSLRRVSRKPVEYVVFTHDRLTEYKGVKSDVIMHEFIHFLSESGCKTHVFEMFERISTPIEFENVTYESTGILTHMIQLSSLNHFFSIQPEEYALLYQVEKELEEGLGLRLNFLAVIEKFHRRMFFERNYYINAFRELSPKVIFTCSSYMKPAVNYAAKACGIPIIELQYAAITKYHHAFDYEGIHDTIQEFYADGLIVWSSYWKKPFLPISQEYIFPMNIYGMPLDHTLQRAIQREERTVVVLSQDVYAKKLVREVLSFAKENPDWTVLYKGHPNEFHYDTLLQEFRACPNIEMYVEQETSVSREEFHRLLQRATYAITVYSSSIFEALHFGCIPRILQWPGYELMNEIIEEEELVCAPTIDELIYTNIKVQSKKEKVTYFTQEELYLPKIHEVKKTSKIPVNEVHVRYVKRITKKYRLYYSKDVLYRIRKLDMETLLRRGKRYYDHFKKKH